MRPPINRGVVDAFTNFLTTLKKDQIHFYINACTTLYNILYNIPIIKKTLSASQSYLVIQLYYLPLHLSSYIPFFRIIVPRIFSLNYV